ncbi:MAG TPA: PIN domain-containing protein [Acidisarcina sp.]
MRVLVDTSVWSVAFRRAGSPLDIPQGRARLELEKLLLNGRAQLLGVVRQELLSGIRERARYDRLLKLFRPFPDVPLQQEDYERAASMHNLCRAHGIAGSSADFLICAASARRHWPILTIDRDFTRYATCLPIVYYSGS